MQSLVSGVGKTLTQGKWPILREHNCLLGADEQIGPAVQEPLRLTEEPAGDFGQDQSFALVISAKKTSS